MNVYWASQHYEDLAEKRRRQGLAAGAATPLFLRQAHERAMDERAERGGRVEHKVREIARRVMRAQARPGGNPRPSQISPDHGSDVESDWKV
jgi:hypothetical protein